MAGRIPLLESVRQAEAARPPAAARPYQPMEGAANYRQAVQHLLFGAEHRPSKRPHRHHQTIGGSGAIKIGADLLKRLLPGQRGVGQQPDLGQPSLDVRGAGFRCTTTRTTAPAPAA